ncbi:MAG: methyltransferase domain-containing protein [Actinobacteria bacterium]|nr:methyltransferase domain-containing protein [Actinomycetota bacterium]
MGDTYTHGHHESVLRSHTWRTAANSAAHLLPHLAPGQRLLDVGCGPGTITVDLADRVAPGAVLGVDASADVIAQAAGIVGERSNVTFAVADVYALDHPDASFDVVHAHQVLQHLTDPVAALREMRRVLAPGGVLAARDSNYAAFWWSPDEPRLDRWLSLYHAVTEANRADADAGRHLLAWAHAAGFTDVAYSSSTWTVATPEDRAWWGGLWADRVTSSSFATQAVDYGLATTDELADLAVGFRTWATSPDAIFVIPHGEILARA